MNSTEARIQTAAGALFNLKKHTKEVTGPIGFLIGATYGLSRAVQLGYRPICVSDARYAVILSRVARSIQTSAPAMLMTDRRSRAWLAGFYYNTALQRIAAAADRLGVHPKGGFSEPESVKKVREEVIKLKHDIRQNAAQRGRGLLQRRDVPMRTSITALGALVRHCRGQRLI